MTTSQTALAPSDPTRETESSAHASAQQTQKWGGDRGADDVANAVRVEKATSAKAGVARVFVVSGVVYKLMTTYPPTGPPAINMVY